MDFKLQTRNINTKYTVFGFLKSFKISFIIEIIHVLYLLFLFYYFLLPPKMAQSTQLRRRNPYITRSNRYIVKTTPSGKKQTYLRKKQGKAPSCGDCKKTLAGIAAKRPAAFARLPKCRRTVQRAYGGSLCVHCVNERVVNGFLEEEMRILSGEAN